MNQNLTLEQQSQFKAALKHFYSGSDDETVGSFFYGCARALIDAHDARETISAPLRILS